MVKGLLRVLTLVRNKEHGFLFPDGGMSYILLLHTYLVQIEGRAKVHELSRTTKSHHQGPKGNLNGMGVGLGNLNDVRG